MSTGRVTGIVSGFDTSSIVESLMALEKQPYEKLDIKKQTEQLRLQAYQAVNTYLLKFRTSVSTLSSSSLWNAKAAYSTNESSLTASASQYAVNGTYSFRVAQLATATQFMSKGFSSSKTAFVDLAEGEDNYQIGTIKLGSAKSRVDNTAKVDHLNGGKGIYRGSVRITDGSNNTSVIDLSGCDTMDDVVRALNESTNAQITASIKDGSLYIKDESGNAGTGSLRIQNVGTGTTATDLGIAGTSEPGDDFIHGRNVYVLGDDMSLSLLNDGLGVEEGYFALRVSGDDSFIDLQIDTIGCQTVGDLVKRVNEAIQGAMNSGVTNPITDSNGNDPTPLLEGLNFGISGDKNSFSLTGVQEDHTYVFFDFDTGLVSQATPAAQLGLHTEWRTAGTGDDEVTFGRVLGDVDSPMLKNLGGVTEGGIGETTAISTRFSADTKLKDLNAGTGLDVSRPMQITLYEGLYGEVAGIKGTTFNLFTPTEIQDFIDAGKTVQELCDLMNDKLAELIADPAINAAGLVGMSFEVDEYNNRLVINGAQAGYTVVVDGTMAQGLGLQRLVNTSTEEGAKGTAVEMDKSDPAYEAWLKELKDFYGQGGNSEPLMDNNGAFNLDPDKGDLTTLGNLILLHGFEPDQIGDLDTFLDGWLKDIRLSFTVKEDDGTYTTHDVTVNLANVRSSLDSTTDIQSFLDLVNDEIQSTFDAYTSTHTPPLEQMNAPKLAVHAYQDRFTWSNMDLSKGWDMDDVGGTFLSSIDMKQSLSHMDSLATSAIDYDVNPAKVGSLDFFEADGTTSMYDVNYGLGITLAGDPDDTLDIEFGEGRSISIRLGDIRDELETLIAGLAPGDEPSMDQYLTILNDLIDTALTAEGSGAVIEFTIDNGNIVLKDTANVDHLIISGKAANQLSTGIPAGGIAAKDFDASQTYTISNLNAATLNEEPIVGLGEIVLEIGGEEVRLQTDGLDGESTLADLIAKLNHELDEWARSDPSLYGDLVNVRFTINDAGTGIAVENNSAKRITFKDTNDHQTIAKDLGLVGEDGEDKRLESYSFMNCGSLNRNYVSRATKVTEYIGANATPGAISITNAYGTTYNLDLSNCETLGDIVDFINSGGDEMYVYAAINERGDGITIYEGYPAGVVVDQEARVGSIQVKDLDGGSTAKKLGFAGTSEVAWDGRYAIDGSLATTVAVMANDTLESIMYRISESGDYKTAIINDGSSINPYRLTISASNTGEASDFVIDCDLDFFGFNQTSRGKDAKVLYGDPNSGSSPVMLSSDTNSNSNAILGLTLELKQASSEWTTITVDTDKDSVKEAIVDMVDAYNELASIISYLDAYDEETGEPGILFGDTSCRSLMESINEIFYDIFNPNNEKLGSLDANGVQNTWTWMDLGISLSAQNSNADGSGSWYSVMELDLDTLDEMIASKWDIVSTMLSSNRNAADSTLGDNVRASASFNGDLADGFDVNNAINNDYNRGGWGAANGVMADGTIADGNNEYTIWFQKPVTMTRMSIYHLDADTSLKDFTVEYLDAATGKWEVLRDISDNSTDANHLGIALPTSVSAIRITASSTNASDDKFRLLDVQVFEDNGLAGKLNQLTTVLGDTQLGFLAERTEEVNTSISDIESQMSRLLERLTAKEESLWRRFTAMETAMGTLQNQANYFSAMMESMTASSS